KDDDHDRQTAEDEQRLSGVPFDIGVVLADEQEDQASEPPQYIGQDRVHLLVACGCPGHPTTHRGGLTWGRRRHLRHEFPPLNRGRCIAPSTGSPRNLGGASDFCGPNYRASAAKTP